MLDFLKRLEQKVTIEISPYYAGEPYQSVAFGIVFTEQNPENFYENQK
ncbi:MAG: hypothetical protein AAF383_22705 [Cyanobacteria bacterium P01_A01_bin.83]